MNVVARAASVRVHDTGQHGIQLPQQADVTGFIEILPDGLEVPERRIDRVVLRYLSRTRKIVRKHSLADEARERSKNVACQPGTSGCQTESWNRNHGVAPPVPKPRVPGENGSRLWRVILGTCRNKLVSSEDELMDRRRGCRSNSHIH